MTDSQERGAGLGGGALTPMWPKCKCLINDCFVSVEIISFFLHIGSHADIRRDAVELGAPD